MTFVLCGIVSVQAAGDEKNGHAYFTKAQLPNMANILPAPPEFESARFVADQSQYLWGKLMRLDEARCAQAQRDAVYSMATIIEEFSGIFGLEITKEDTPEIYSILQDVCASCDSIYSDAKAYFNRMRPYTYYNEGTIVPEKEEKHRYEAESCPEISYQLSDTNSSRRYPKRHFLFTPLTGSASNGWSGHECFG